VIGVGCYLNGELFEVCWWDGQKLNGKRDTKRKNEGKDGIRKRKQVRGIAEMTRKEENRDDKERNKRIKHDREEVCKTRGK